MTNIESSSPLQFESTEPVLSEPRNTETIVEVTRGLQRLRIMNLGAPSLKKDMTNERIPLRIRIPPCRSEPLITLGVEPFTNDIAVGEITRPNSA